VIPLVTSATVAFWICGPLALAGAVGLVAFRKAVYSALSLAFLMINLAVLYAALEAPFMAAAQVIVYTGAIMMLFLFVLMLVGVDRPDSLVETIKGHRIITGIAVLGAVGLLAFGIGSASVGQAAGLGATNDQYGGNVQTLASLIFGRYVFAFELTSALLITAATGAMVLAQHARLSAAVTQKGKAAERMKQYAEHGTHPGSLPNSGVIALHNSIATPALLPDGSVAPESVSKTLSERGAIVDAVELGGETAQVFTAIESAETDRRDVDQMGDPE